MSLDKFWHDAAAIATAREVRSGAAAGERPPPGERWAVPPRSDWSSWLDACEAPAMAPATSDALDRFLAERRTVER